MIVIVGLVWSNVFYLADLHAADTPQFRARAYQPRVAVPITNTQIKLKRLTATGFKPVLLDKDVKEKGPDPALVLDLSDSIENVELLEDLGVASGWDPHLIFQDKAASNVFYYLPREILLRRDEQGYRLSVQYNTMAEPGQPSVMLTAELDASQRKGDTKLLKAILREALGLKPSAVLKVKALQGVGATADMQALTAGLSLTADRVHLAAPASLKQSFRLTLALTQDEVEEVLAQIAREGLAGSLNVKVGDANVPIPIRIQYSHFAGDRVDGFDQWIANKPSGILKNTTDFPLKLTSLNAYRMSRGHLVRVSKQLKQSQAISPGRSRSFKLPAAGKVLGEGLLVAWPGTSLDTGCASCLQLVDQRVRQGVALAQGSRIKLEAIPGVFSEFGLYKLLVHVRSPYFVAGGITVKEREVELTEETNLKDRLVFYIPGDVKSDAMLYLFSVQV
jgi:hypothetical protein